VPPVRLNRTMVSAVTMTTKLTFAPTERSNPPVAIDTVTPIATTATIATDCSTINAFAQVPKAGLTSAKNTVISTSTATSP